MSSSRRLDVGVDLFSAELLWAALERSIPNLTGERAAFSEAASFCPDQTIGALPNIGLRGRRERNHTCHAGTSLALIVVIWGTGRVFSAVRGRAAPAVRPSWMVRRALGISSEV